MKMNMNIKTKDLVYIVISVIILGIVGYLGYQQLNPASGTKGVTVEVVQPVDQGFDAAALDRLRDEKQSKDFSVPVDLKNGVGTSTPFGQQ